jgi:hypothetical protein
MNTILISKWAALSKKNVTKLNGLANRQEEHKIKNWIFSSWKKSKTALNLIKAKKAHLK